MVRSRRLAFLALALALSLHGWGSPSGAWAQLAPLPDGDNAPRPPASRAKRKPSGLDMSAALDVFVSAPWQNRKYQMTVVDKLASLCQDRDSNPDVLADKGF